MGTNYYDLWSKIIVLVCYIHGCFMTLLLETRQWRLDRKAALASRQESNSGRREGSCAV